MTMMSYFQYSKHSSASFFTQPTMMSLLDIPCSHIQILSLESDARQLIIHVKPTQPYTEAINYLQYTTLMMS